MPDNSTHDSLTRPAATIYPIHDLLTRRFSSRAFDPNRSVSREQLAVLLEAARWAPSCNGDEPWRYLIWDRGRDPEGFQKAFECLGDKNRCWVKNVPLLILSNAGRDFGATGKPNRWTQHDTGAASVCLALQAVALGLVAHQMGGFDVEKARAAFAIPPEYTPMAMIAIGYATTPDILDDETKAKDLKPRARKPFAERFFEGGWGKGYTS
jgi:nitroreductase